MRPRKSQNQFYQEIHALLIERNPVKALILIEQYRKENKISKIEEKKLRPKANTLANRMHGWQRPQSIANVHANGAYQR